MNIKNHIKNYIKKIKNIRMSIVSHLLGMLSGIIVSAVAFLPKELSFIEATCEVISAMMYLLLGIFIGSVISYPLGLLDD